MSRIVKSIEIDQWFPRSERRGSGEVGSDENVLGLDSVCGCTTLGVY